MAEVAFSGVDKRTVEGDLPVQLCNYTDVFYSRRIVVGMDFLTATATRSEKNKWALKKGDVLFTQDSETPDEIGITCSESAPAINATRLSYAHTSTVQVGAAILGHLVELRAD